MNNKLISKINDFLEREFKKNSADIAILKNEDGSYELFNRYTINSQEQYKYTVTKKYTYLTKTFSSLKNAVTWCVFEHRNKIEELYKIEELDRKLDGLELSIELHRFHIKSSKDEQNKLIYSAKLSNDQAKKKKCTAELTSLIRESKVWQTQRFNKKDQKSN